MCVQYKAGYQRNLAAVTGGGDEVLRAELEEAVWTRVRLEWQVQAAEDKLQKYQQHALEAEDAIATTAAALLHQGNSPLMNIIIAQPLCLALCLAGQAIIWLVSESSSNS